MPQGQQGKGHHRAVDSQIAEKGNSLDLGLIRDDSVLDYNDLPDPAESAEEVAANLEEAVDLLMSVVKELRALEVQD